MENSITQLIPYSAIIAALSGILAVSLGYFFGIRHKRYDQKIQERKSLRRTVSNLLIIWNELHKLYELTGKPKHLDHVFLKIPFIIKRFLKLDKAKLNSLKAAYLESLTDFKEINAYQYFKLESSLNSFDELLTEILEPLIHDKGISVEEKMKIFGPILKDMCDDLESIITTSIVKLPRKERKELKNIFNINSNEKDIKIPEFIIGLVNESVSLKESITSADIIKCLSNETVIFLLQKSLTPQLIKEIFTKNIFNALKFTFYFKASEEEILRDPKIKKISRLLVDGFDLTEEENSFLVNKKEFYSLIMGVSIKIFGMVPYPVKRECVKFNNGTITIKMVIDAVRKDMEGETAKLESNFTINANPNILSVKS